MKVLALSTGLLLLALAIGLGQAAPLPLSPPQNAIWIKLLESAPAEPAGDRMAARDAAGEAPRPPAD